MYTTVTQSDFIDAFEKHGRKDQFSHEALIALFEFYDEHYDDCNLDVIMICCEWGEYTKEELFREFHKQYFPEIEWDKDAYKETREPEYKPSDLITDRLVERLSEDTILLEVEHEKTRYLMQHF